MGQQAKTEFNQSEAICQTCSLDKLCLPMGLGSEDAALLDQYVKRKRMYKRGQVIYRAGERFSSVFAIRTGAVKTCVSTEDGRLQITGFHISGDLLGLNGLDERSYTADAIALETTSVCEISLACFEEFVDRIPVLNYQMMRMMSKEIKQNQELMLLLGKKNAEEKLATFLLALSRRFAMRNYSSTEFNLSMSRSDIGDYLGIAEETVCRLFTRFQEDGLINCQRRSIVLNDLKKLADLAHETCVQHSCVIPLPEKRRCR